MRFFITQKPGKENRYIGLFEHKYNKGWSFINFSKGTIAPCVFETEEDAVRDLEQYKKDGKIIYYKEVEENDFLRQLIYDNN